MSKAEGYSAVATTVFVVSFGLSGASQLVAVGVGIFWAAKAVGETVAESKRKR